MIIYYSTISLDLYDIKHFSYELSFDCAHLR